MLVLPPRSLQPSFLSHPSEEPCSFLLSSEFCPVRARRPLIVVVLCTAWFPMDKFSDAVCFRPSGNTHNDPYCANMFIDVHVDDI
jgi:hypothetical protein